MTTTPDSSKIITPLRLIFWGSLICAIQNNFGEYNFIPAFIGLAMVSRGVFSLSRIPVSKPYRILMRVVVFFSILFAVASLAIGMLSLFIPILKNPPNGFLIALVLFICLVYVLCVVFFCRCMLAYCTIAQWENACHSWKFSMRLFTFGVLLPLAVLAVPLFLVFNSLEFEPENPSYATRSGTNEEGLLQITVYKNDKIFFTKTAPEGVKTLSLSQSEYEPPPGPRWTVGKWAAPHTGTLDQFLQPPIIVVALMFTWAVIHLLVSLSRMKSTAERIPFSHISATLCQRDKP